MRLLSRVIAKEQDAFLINHKKRSLKAFPAEMKLKEVNLLNPKRIQKSYRQIKKIPPRDCRLKTLRKPAA